MRYLYKFDKFIHDGFLFKLFNSFSLSVNINLIDCVGQYIFVILIMIFLANKFSIVLVNIFPNKCALTSTRKIFTIFFLYLPFVLNGFFLFLFSSKMVILLQ